MAKTKRLVALLLVACAVAGSAAQAASADPPGPGDKQCRGATGNNNPHCPPPPNP